MKQIKFALLVLILVNFQAIAQKRSKHVLILGFDGFSTEAFKAVKHPNIDRMFADGTLSVTTRPVMPSVTMPNWTSHLTGSGPEEHGVTGNDWTLQKHSLSAVETDADGYYPSIFKVLKDKQPSAKTAFYYNWKELIYPINKKYLDEVSFEDKDGYRQNYKKAVDFMYNNRNNATLVFLYDVHTDHAGHSFGWMSPEYIKAIEEADQAVGEMLDSLVKKDLYKDTHILLITDHGGIKKGHGGVSMSEMQVPWLITGPGIKKQGITEFQNSNKNTSLVLAKIFGIKIYPESWTGTVPKGIFK